MLHRGAGLAQVHVRILFYVYQLLLIASDKLFLLQHLVYTPTRATLNPNETFRCGNTVA